jgi:hypothetical protein
MELQVDQNIAFTTTTLAFSESILTQDFIEVSAHDLPLGL